MALLGDLCRINTLYMIMRAGSGHIGSSFSSTDLITWLWTQELVNPNSGAPGSDVYFSSKGHDAPALYSLLIALEKLDFDLVHKLRQIDGLPGHPDVGTPFIATNTGSLGMGISKAYGMARANRYTGAGGRIFVMTGDGELQEGQIWESLQPVANEKLGEIVVVVDHNKYQSDTLVSAVSDLGPLEDKFRAFGWEVQRGDGHDPATMARVLAHFPRLTDRPKVFIADTIKGRGVSFMEGLACGDQTYHFHAGAPSLEDYLAATAELLDRVNGKLAALRQPAMALASGPLPVRITPAKPEKIVLAYGDELLAMARQRPEIVVLDADLLTDCGIEAFRAELPDRFIECGIAEQHMVSAAGGLALRGMLPVVHSFACFLTTRANEHIYNNATERRKIIYVGTLAGVVPGGPGPFAPVGSRYLGDRRGARPDRLRALLRARSATRRFAGQSKRTRRAHISGSSTCRSISRTRCLRDYRLSVGRGVALRRGTDVAIVGYGTVLLSNAYRAAESSRRKGSTLRSSTCHGSTASTTNGCAPSSDDSQWSSRSTIITSSSARA